MLFAVFKTFENPYCQCILLHLIAQYIPPKFFAVLQAQSEKKHADCLINSLRILSSKKLIPVKIKNKSAYGGFYVAINHYFIIRSTCQLKKLLESFTVLFEVAKNMPIYSDYIQSKSISFFFPQAILSKYFTKKKRLRERISRGMKSNWSKAKNLYDTGRVFSMSKLH